jgi:hypothetical protein
MAHVAGFRPEAPAEQLSHSIRFCYGGRRLTGRAFTPVLRAAA